MTTQDAITLVTGLMNTNTTLGQGYTDANTALSIVLEQLQGVLNTPSADLTAAQAALAAEQAAHATDNTNNEATIASLNAQIASLQAILNPS